MGILGDPIHLEVISTDASGAGVAATLYKAGSVTAFTLAANQIISITDIIFVSTAGGVYDIVMAAVTAGMHVAKGNAAALGGLAHHFETPFDGRPGIVPKLIAAAGQVDLVMQGYVKEV